MNYVAHYRAEIAGLLKMIDFDMKDCASLQDIEAIHGKAALLFSQARRELDHKLKFYGACARLSQEFGQKIGKNRGR